MTDELEKAKANMARAIMRRAVATADADESEEWFAEQFTTAALDAVRETHHLIPLATVDDGELVERSAEVRSELWAALIGNDQSHKDLIDRIEALTTANTGLHDEIEDLHEKLAAAYIALSGTDIHASDCATSNAPAYEPGPCDCKETAETFTRSGNV